MHKLRALAERRLLERLRDERRKAAADFASGKIAACGYKLDPQRHRSLAAVAQLEDGAALNGAVINEVEDAHLVEVEDDLILVWRQNAELKIAQSC